jgi:hypothetical protein
MAPPEEAVAMSSGKPVGYYDDKPFVYRGTLRDQENLARFKRSFVRVSEAIISRPGGAARTQGAGAVSKRRQYNDWAAPELSSHDFVSADAWTHSRPVSALRFTSPTGRPSLRLILDADLQFGEAERLMAEALETLYGPEEDAEE